MVLKVLFNRSDSVQNEQETPTNQPTSPQTNQTPKPRQKNIKMQNPNQDNKDTKPQPAQQKSSSNKA